jgi:hypothetical protein
VLQECYRGVARGVAREPTTPRIDELSKKARKSDQAYYEVRKCRWQGCGLLCFKNHDRLTRVKSEDGDDYEDHDDGIN